MKTRELIRKYRLEKGMTQFQLAEKVGTVESSIRRYELGLSVPRTQRLKEIADALEVPFSCLLEFDLEKYKEKTLEEFTTEEILLEIKRRIENATVYLSYYENTNPYQNEPCNVNFVKLARYAKQCGKKLIELTDEEVEMFSI